MAGKTNLVFTNFSAKKLLSKAHTSLAASDNEETIGSAVQVSAQTIFSEDLPTSPSQTLYLLQSASDGKPTTVEYVEFELLSINASYYDANTYDSAASAQAAGFHAYAFALKQDYESNSSNAAKGAGIFDNGRHLSGTLGAVQIVPPSFSSASPNPYICNIYSGTRDVADKISLTDEIDWYVDYYNGILFVQDFDSAKLPTRAKAFVYVGKMLSASLGSAGSGGSGGAVGWIASGNGGISTTGSLFVGTSGATASSSDIYFSNLGEARFNEQGNSVDFRVESNTKENAFLIDGSTDQVLILSGGSDKSFNEAIAADVNFYVSGAIGSKNSSVRGTAVFGGDVVISGSITDKDGDDVGGAGFSGGNGSNNLMVTADGAGKIVAESNIQFNGTFLAVTGSIFPGLDNTYNLGAEDRRFANIYTGDLHLRNDRGDWTIVEEEEYLSIYNNKSKKRYRFVLEEVE